MRLVTVNQQLRNGDHELIAFNAETIRDVCPSVQLGYFELNVEPRRGNIVRYTIFGEGQDFARVVYCLQHRPYIFGSTPSNLPPRK